MLTFDFDASAAEVLGFDARTEIVIEASASGLNDVAAGWRRIIGPDL